MSEPVATTPVTLFMGELNPPTGVPTKLPALPTPSSDPESMRVFLEKVKEILEVYEGIRGSKFDQVVTWRDMFQNGMVDLTVSGTRFTAYPLSPTINLPITSDFTPPPAPTGFTVSSGMTTIILSWTVATYGNHAYTEVWRSDTNNLAGASLIGTTNSFAYADSVGFTGSTKYYWIRFVSQMDVKGPYNSATGTGSSTGLVGTADLTDLIITANKIAVDAVTNTKIADAAINSQKLADLSVIASKLADSSVTNTKIADSAINSQKLADLAVEAAKLADSSVTSTKIANLAVGTAAIATAAITAAKIANLAVGNAAIANAAITAAKIDNLAVGNAAIANGAITNAKIGDLAVDNAKIADATIVSGKIADAAITTAKIQDASITTAKIGLLQVTNALIQNAAISSAKIGDGEITNAKINDVIQSSDFSSGSSGWRIQKSGNAELNNATFRGTLNIRSSSSGARTEMTNDVIKVFDSAGTLRVKIGNLNA